MFARTERLLLRPGWVEDAPALAHAFAREDIISKLATAPWPYAMDDAVAYLGRSRKTHEADLLIFQRTLGAPRLIGGISLAAGIHHLELGYWIVPSHWGLGFATEAGHAVVAMARDTLRLDRLVASYSDDNPASARVLEKLGFVPTEREAQFDTTSKRRTEHVSMSLELQPLALAA